MSLTLNKGTKPDSLEVHTFPLVRQEEKVFIGKDIKMTIPDFCEMVKYVLTNTQLQVGDARLELLSELQKVQIVETRDGGRQLVISTPKVN